MSAEKRGSKMHLAVLSGVFASGGGVCAKLAGFYEIAGLWSAMTKLALLLAMVTSNTLGCTLFVKALAGSGNSLPATVTTSGVNFFCSAAVGLLVFGESTTARWWCGSLLVLLGLLLICHSASASASLSEQSRKEEEEEEEEDEEEEEEAEEHRKRD